MLLNFWEKIVISSKSAHTRPILTLTAWTIKAEVMSNVNIIDISQPLVRRFRFFVMLVGLSVHRIT